MFKLFLIYLIGVTLLISSPFAVIWSLNILFPILEIEYTIQNGFAILVLTVFYIFIRNIKWENE